MQMNMYRLKQSPGMIRWSEILIPVKNLFMEPPASRISWINLADVNVRYASAFRKHYKKRIDPFPTLQTKFEERVEMLLTNPRNPLLHDHPLKGAKSGSRSCSITGDIRVVYRKKDEK